MAETAKRTVPHITPAMYNAARRTLGHCASCDDKLQIFEAAGYSFPDQKQMNDDVRRKAEGLIAAWEMYYADQNQGNGNER